MLLGMYVHTHWGYNHPYSARTWTLADWEGYLGGLAALGYNLVMVWPQFDSMSPSPNASDRAALKVISDAIDLARAQFGMRTVIVAAANTIGTQEAASYPFQSRPYFLVEKRVNPKDKVEVGALLEGRRNQFALLANADALAIIDSDPGGYAGSTNEEFVALAMAQLEAFRSHNPRAEFIYWMLAGWESYCRFWALAAADQSGRAQMWDDWKGDDFVQTLSLMREHEPEPWCVYAWLPQHIAALSELGLTEKAICFPYGLVEGEPTFPLTNCDTDALAQGLSAGRLRACPRGVMANAQTHCLQLPHTFMFAHLAHGGRREDVDLAASADRLLPGLGGLIAAGWRSIERREPQGQRAAAGAIRSVAGRQHAGGDLAGLLLGDADRFLEDLAVNLELRAALGDMAAAFEQGADRPRVLRRALDVLVPYQHRLGFGDAYGGPLADAFNGQLARLADPELDAVLRLFTDWRDPTVRNGLALRLLEAADRYCRARGC